VRINIGESREEKKKMKTLTIPDNISSAALGGKNRTSGQTGSSSFTETLQGAIREANALQNQAEEAVKNMQINNRGSIHEVIIAMEKADISFRTMLQVRNKVLDAYQEIMRMTV